MNSVLKGNVSHKNASNLRQCGQCIINPEKNLASNFRGLKWLILGNKTSKTKNFWSCNVLLTILGHFHSWKFLHVMYYMYYRASNTVSGVVYCVSLLRTLVCKMADIKRHVCQINFSSIRHCESLFYFDFFRKTWWKCGVLFLEVSVMCQIKVQMSLRTFNLSTLPWKSADMSKCVAKFGFVSVSTICVFFCSAASRAFCPPRSAVVCSGNNLISSLYAQVMCMWWFKGAVSCGKQFGEKCLSLESHNMNFH